MGFNTTNKSGSNTPWGECNCTELRCRHWKNWDMTQLPRITITDDMSDKDVAMFTAYNDNCEEVEDLWIELDLKLIEKMEQAQAQLAKEKKDKRKRRNGGGGHYRKGCATRSDRIIEREVYGSFEECPNEIMEDLKEEFDF